MHFLFLQTVAELVSFQICFKNQDKSKWMEVA